MHSFAILIATCLLSAPLFAQEVEFNIPTEIDIVQGQLSVVFNDHVDESEALKIVQQLGYDILDSRFSPLVLNGELIEPVTQMVMEALTAQEEVIEARQYTTPTIVHTTPTETQNEAHPKPMITVSFQAGTTPDRAKKILKKYLKLASMDIHSIPNEIIVAVGAQDEEAFERLQRHKNVKWVSYIGATGDL